MGALATLAGPTPAEAQRRDRMGPGQRENMEQAREVLEARLRVFFANAVRTRLDLSDAEMDRVQETLRAFEEERRSLAREEAELRRSLGPALGDGREELSEAEAREALDRLAALREAEAGIFRREQEALLDVLTPGEVIRLYQLREALVNRLRNVRMRGPHGPGGPPVHRPPPPPLFDGP